MSSFTEAQITADTQYAHHLPLLYANGAQVSPLFHKRVSQTVVNSVGLDVSFVMVNVDVNPAITGLIHVLRGKAIKVFPCKPGLNLIVINPT